MAEQFTLSHPSGNFTVEVEGSERRDVFLRRGYTPVEEAKAVAKPGQKRRSSKEK